MSLFDKRMSEEKRASFEMAEDSRESEWKCPSFAAGLFRGKIEKNLIWPYPAQSKEDAEAGRPFLEKLEEFLKTNLNPDEVDVTREIPKHVIDGLVQLGAFAIKIPKEYDGLGLSQTNYNKAVHLIGSYCGSTAALVSAHQSIGVPQPLLDFGTSEQKKKFLPRFRKGSISGFALTEHNAGSDPRRIETTATPVEGGKYYLINGQKLWCTNGNVADILVVMAQTPPKVVKGKEIKQITAFIVETNTPGFEVSYRCKFMGLNAIQNGILTFKDVKVPAENIILGAGEGLKLAYVTLNTGRLTLPAAVTGMSKWCLKVSRTWAKERVQWGSPIGEHEAVASKLSSMAAKVFTMDAMTWLVSSMVTNKTCDIRLEAAMVKLFCTEESWKIVNEAVQIRGGRGYETAPSLMGRKTKAAPLERAMRDSRVNTILEGSSEIMHLFIAREALDFHLKGMKELFSPDFPIARKIGIMLSKTLFYLSWYPALWLPNLFSAWKISSHKGFRKHTVFMESASRRLARDVFHKMTVYQKKLVVKQNILNRFVDIGTDLFAMACALSYAEYLASKDKKDANSINLADLFCKEAEERIKTQFKAVSRNYDRFSRFVAKGVLAGDYEWLENDIIK